MGIHSYILFDSTTGINGDKTEPTKFIEPKRSASKSYLNNKRGRQIFFLTYHKGTFLQRNNNCVLPPMCDDHLER